MKLLIWYTDKFEYKTSRKSLAEVDELNESKIIENALAAFIQVEKEDEEYLGQIETKMLKQIKWAAKKNETKRVILHSFAHLSESKAEPEKTKSLFDSAQTRLSDSGYEVYQTPFGYFLDLGLYAPGHSMARIFKDLKISGK